MSKFLYNDIDCTKAMVIRVLQVFSKTSQAEHSRSKRSLVTEHADLGIVTVKGHLVGQKNDHQQNGSQ